VFPGETIGIVFELISSVKVTYLIAEGKVIYPCYIQASRDKALENLEKEAAELKLESAR
jgi:hypothetical protein